MSDMTGQGKKNIIASIMELFQKRDCLDVRNLRLQHLKYMLIFPLAPVFANMQEVLLGSSAYLLELDAMTLMGSAYCVGAGLLFAAAKPNTISRSSHLLAVFTAAMYIFWLLLPEGRWSLPAAMLFAASLGGCAAQAAFSYTFVLNNAERFLGAAAISLFFALNQLDFGLSLVSGLFPKAYLTALVAGTCICLLRYRADDFSDVRDSSGAVFTPALRLTLYYFVAHYLIEIFYTYLPGTSMPEALVANGVTGILAVALAVILQFITRRSVWNMCNLFFITIIATYVLYVLSEDSALQSAARLIHGFEQLGYISAYYLLGCVFKKHGSFWLFKWSLIVILPVSAMAYVIPGLIAVHVPDSLPLVATLTSGILFILFILMSPVYSRYLFFSDWSEDFYAVDMTEALKNLKEPGALKKYGLSPREREVVALLLKGESTKPIAEALGISIHTVNFHIKNLYKKLGIRSRSEMFAKLSAANFSSSDTREGDSKKIYNSLQRRDMKKRF